MMKIFSLILSLFISGICFGQMKTETGQNGQIHKDSRIDSLLAKQTAINKNIYLTSSRTGPGFRVLVTNTDDRNKAMEIKSEMLQEFPQHKTYLLYQSPYYKVQIGNFETREEAEELKKEIGKYYSQGLVVIPAMVELKPPLDSYLK